MISPDQENTQRKCPFNQGPFKGPGLERGGDCPFSPTLGRWRGRAGEGCLLPLPLYPHSCSLQPGRTGGSNFASSRGADLLRPRCQRRPGSSCSCSGGHSKSPKHSDHSRGDSPQCINREVPFRASFPGTAAPN